jgi:hypothetical protein
LPWRIHNVEDAEFGCDNEERRFWQHDTLLSDLNIIIRPMDKSSILVERMSRLVILMSLIVTPVDVSDGREGGINEGHWVVKGRGP